MLDPYVSGEYRTHNPDWHEADAPHKAAALARLIRYCGIAPRTVVDVGCGTGGVIAALKAAFDAELPNTAWEGWDPAEDAIRTAREREGERLQYVAGDFLQSERRADVVLLIDVVEHVVDDVAFLEALRPRADWFLLRVPLELSVLDVVRPQRVLAARAQYGHRHFYTREMALALLDTAGFRVDTWRYDRVPPPTDTARRRVVDAARRAAFAWDADRAARWLGGFSLLVCARPR